jgi:hypothetical protein
MKLLNQKLTNNLGKMGHMALTATVVAGQMFASIAHASIPSLSRSAPVQPKSFAISQDFSKGLDASLIHPMVSKRDYNSNDVAQVIPNDLQATSDVGSVATQILDHSLNNFFNSPAVRNSDFGRSATHVEKSMEGNVAFGGETPHSIRHSFKFAMKATQAKALIEYTGVTNAQLSYSAASQKADLEVKEKLVALNTQVVYNHVAGPGDQTDMLSLRWVW